MGRYFNLCDVFQGKLSYLSHTIGRLERENIYFYREAATEQLRVGDNLHGQVIECRAHRSTYRAITVHKISPTLQHLHLG